MNNPTLLIADDDPTVRSILSTALGRQFDLLPAARDADEAIAIAAEHHPALAIIDVEMPGGGGLRATRELRKTSPATAIVVLSADESDAVVREMISSGAITYVRKGADPHALAATLRQAISVHATLSAGGVS